MRIISTYMNSPLDSKHVLFRTARQLLRPVVRLLLRSGVTWREFADLSKTVFVEVATDDYGKGGRPTNASRVAILTGLSRRDVAAQRQLLAGDGTPSPSHAGNAARVLSGWYQDADFLDAEGRPLALPREGAGPSFSLLLDRYAGDIPRVAMLKELLSANAIVENERGHLEVRSRYYMPSHLDPQSVLRAGDVWRDVGNNITHNLTRGEDQPSRFEGRATNEYVDPAHLPALRRLVEERGQAFLEMIDAWLTEHEVGRGESKHGARAGIGIYQIEDVRKK